MKLDIRPGKYVVAVSGGVDSVVLMDLLYKSLGEPEKHLLIAHFDHGIRLDSAEDRKFVEELADKYRLEFFYAEGHLGPDASEALAREKRYEFLNRVKADTGAEAIVTAHHKDDLIETIIINIIRGTGRKGLSSLADGPGIIRPLLDFSKEQILSYAKENRLEWHEDETNTDEKYFRNYVRHNIADKLSEKQKEKLFEIAGRSKNLNEEIDRLVTELFLVQEGVSRRLFSGLSHSLSAEIVAGWLRKESLGFDKKSVERIVVALKTAKPGKRIEAGKGRYFIIEKGMIRLNPVGAV